MNRATVILRAAAVLASLTFAPSGAADLSGMPTAAEMPFVKSVSADLGSRFATIAAAESAGYIRYTDEDDTGAISYANRDWTSVDAKHPSQLWYDHAGRLIGADFSVPYVEDKPPHLFGVNPARWSEFHQHVHYGLAGPDGTTKFGATGAKKIVAAGGDPTKPTAANLVAAGIAKSPSDVKFVFEFPAIWDLSIWVIPNANGAFADKNPTVKPVNPPKPGMDM
jgi:hypothetical protein